MYYKENQDIEISYIQSSDPPYQENVGIHPGNDYTKKTIIIIKNNSENSQKVEIGVQGGLVGKELVLEEGRTKIEEVAKFEIKSEEVIVEEYGIVGEKVEFEVVEKNGYIYDGAEILNEKGEVILIVDKTKNEFVMPTGNISIRIKWKQKSYLIAKEEVTGGSITIGNSATVGSEVSFSVVESKGYDYGGSIIKDTSGNILLELDSNVKKFYMPDTDIVIIPKWIAKKYTI